MRRGTSASGPFSQIATTASLSYTDTDVLSGTAYYYTIVALNADNTSAACAAASAVSSGSGTWIAQSDGDWNSGGNWLDGQVAFGAGRSATFAQSGGITVNQNVVGLTLGSLSVTGGNVTLAGNGMTLDVASGTPSVTVAANRTLLVSGAVGGSDGLVLTGPGTLILANANSYSGQTDIQAGTLVAAHNNALGAGGHTGETMSIIQIGATLALQGGVSINEHFHFWGSGLGGLGALRSLSGNNSLTDSYCLRSDVAVGVDTDTLTVADFYQDGGAFGLTKNGAGTLAVSAFSYTGNTNVEAGTLRLGAASLADTSTVSIASAAKLDLNFSGSDTVSTLYINNIQQPRGTWSATRDATHFAGTGALVVTSGPEPVGDGTWTSTSDGNWSSVGNWRDTLPANGADFTATFSQSSASTITVDAGRTIGNLVFGGANFILTGGPLTLASSSGASSVTADVGHTVIATTALTGSVGLQKSGDGTLALGAANSYSGATTVSAGTLRVMADTTAGVFIANAGFEIPAFGENGWNYNPSGASWSFSSNSAGIGRNGSPWVTTAPEGVQSGFVQNNGTLSQTLTVTTGGFYDLSFKAANRPGYADSGIAVQIDGTTVKSYPAGTFASGGVFQTFVVRGVQLNAGSRTFAFVGSQNGGDSATAIDDVRLSGYAAGSLPDGTALDLTGGTLQLDVAQTVASLSGNAGSNVINPIALTVSDASVSTFEGGISGAGSLVKVGTGTLTLTGANSYTGTTLVNNGILRINGSTSASSAVTVANAATLGGTGNISGDVTVNTGGTLAPGASVGTLAAGSTTINGTLAIEISGSSADRLNVSGNLNITNATLAITGTLTAQEYVIANYGTLIGTAFASITGLPDGYGVDYSSNQIRIVANPTFGSWIAENYSLLADKAATADPDKDGISNALEYVLGGDPSLPNSNIAPALTTSGNNLVFTFQRADPSETPDITLVVEASTDLKTWPETYAVSTTTETSSSGVSIQENSTSPDTITVTIPRGGTTAQFARLQVLIAP